MTDILSAELLPAAVTAAPGAIEIAQRVEIDCQIATAKKYPRSISAVKNDMLTFATLDEETAQGCFYSLPRGGKTIQGPSVRLAEIAAHSYGNMRTQTRVVQVVTGENPHVVVQAVCLDLEKNVAVTMEKRRRIVGKKSKGGAIDEDDINLACNACTSIAFRDAVFKVVPMALVKPVCDAAMKVAIGDAKTLSNRRTGAVQALEKMGAIRSRILAAVGAATIEDVDLDGLGQLIGIFTAIRDGNMTVDDAFPKPEIEIKGDKAKEGLAKANAVPLDAAAAKAIQDTKDAADLAAEANRKEAEGVGQ